MGLIDLDFNTLLDATEHLEASLFYWRYCDNGIWPLDELEDEEVQAFIDALYQLSHECLCMQLRVNAPELAPYDHAVPEYLTRPELIVLTRQLIFCCDTRLIREYRAITGRERQVIRLLEQAHAQLIGAHYFAHPHVVSVSSRDIRFR